MVHILLIVVLALPGLAGQLDLMVPMRDGVKLHTVVETPDGKGPWPALLTRTPYEMARAGEARSITSKGYVRVIQNVRGQLKSEGKYNAFVDDINDGYDAVEWIAKQRWCNGKVGMFGGSASGMTINMAAIGNPPHLLAAHVSVATGSLHKHAQYPGGVFLKSMIEGWMKGRGVEPSREARPLEHAYDGEQQRRDMRNYYSKINIPMINTGGWYDIFQQGTVDNFVGLQTRGGDKARGKQKLLMDGFGHGQELQSELQPPKEAHAQRAADMLRWFDYWMKGIDNGIMKEPAVRYWVLGDAMDKSAPGNVWRTGDTWPPPSTATSYYLEANARLSREVPSAEGKESYRYDPRDPAPTAGGNNLNLPKGPFDQRKVSGRPDMLKYETEPLRAAVEIGGPVSAELFVSTDAEDTDFIAKLVDVYPNGYEALVMDQPFRLRYFNDLAVASRPRKNQTYRITIDLWSTAIAFNKGHKIALHVTSSNSPRFEPHSNTWEPVITYEKSMVATNTVHHSPKQASRLVLPVTKVYE